MNEATSHDLVVIGAGVAGLSAARRALRDGLSVAYLEAQTFGGLVLGVNELDGAIRGSGAELAAGLMEEVAGLGGENLEGAASAVTAEGGEIVVTSSAGRHRARSLIVASGAAPRKLGIPGEAELEHRGVSHCADCDGPMLQGQDVAVVGGGDSALQSALSLARYCRLVHLVHRGSAFRAQPHLVAAVQGAANIRVHWRSEVSEVLGTGGVEGVRVAGEVIPCAGFFPFIGLQPASDFLPATLARDERGALRTSSALETTLSGVFAAGAVRSGCGGTVADAIADGEAAARAAAAHPGSAGQRRRGFTAG